MTIIRNCVLRSCRSNLIIDNRISSLLQHNFCSKLPPTSENTQTKKLSKYAKYRPEAVKKNVEGYVFTRYFDYVKNYDKALEKTFPKAVLAYRIFFDGVKEFFADMKYYLKISRILSSSPEGLRALTRKELELYQQIPRDMLKIAPALLFSAIPFVGNAVFPLIYMWPRKLLTSHFWTIQQKCEFQELYLKERLSNNRKVLRHLQAKLTAVHSNPLYPKFCNILGLLGSGQHPTADEIIEIRNIFAQPPYTLRCLSSNHISNILQIHGLWGGPFKRIRLIEQAFLLHHMDLAIKREGGVHNMNTDALRYSCYLRGLNPANLSNDSLIEWLRLWIKVSLELKEEHISLFLHLPIFIGYNHPNNWKLIH